MKKQKVNRKCTNCGKIKSLNGFAKNYYLCKLCRKEYDKQYRIKNKKRIEKEIKKYQKQKAYNLKKYQAEYYQDHKEKKKAKRRIYVTENRDKINEAERNKRKNDLNFKLASNLRSRLRRAINRNQKIGSAVKDLGCSIFEFKIYLEERFYLHPDTKIQMDWDNYGIFGWHIDHIKPLSSFDLTDRDQFLKACHYTNLQPLWMKDNLEKANKQYIGEKNVKKNK